MIKVLNNVLIPLAKCNTPSFLMQSSQKKTTLYLN